MVVCGQTVLKTYYTHKQIALQTSDKDMLRYQATFAYHIVTRGDSSYRVDASALARLRNVIDVIVHY